jgi:hypothetical protein
MFSVTEKVDDLFPDIIAEITAEFNARAEKLDAIIRGCSSLEWACRKILSNEAFGEWHEIVSEILAWAVNKQIEADASLSELYGWEDSPRN